jgi:hypothetical protein
MFTLNVSMKNNKLLYESVENSALHVVTALVSGFNVLRSAGWGSFSPEPSTLETSDSKDTPLSWISIHLKRLIIVGIPDALLRKAGAEGICLLGSPLLYAHSRSIKF